MRQSGHDWGRMRGAAAGRCLLALQVDASMRAMRPFAQAVCARPEGMHGMVRLCGMRPPLRCSQVLPLGASKGVGVSWLLERLGVDPAAVMALGDGEQCGNAAGLERIMRDMRRPPRGALRLDLLAPSSALAVNLVALATPPV